MGFGLRAGEAVVRLAQLAADAGIGGIVCSAKEVASLREKLGSKVTLVTPGVRLPEDAVGDQKRVVTPYDAVCAGADYLVVGRPITRSPDPVAAARRFAADMQRAAQ
jgi:orotidine-5'-phosphate decarboxylase